jgi:hypothetical protein
MAYIGPDGSEVVSNAYVSGTPVAHRAGVTAADTVDPTNPTTIGSAVGFATSTPGIVTITQCLDFDIVLTATGVGTAVVQEMFWDSVAAAWFGGAVYYLTNASVVSLAPTIPVAPQPVTCPGAIRSEVRGRTVYLKVLAISGTGATLAATAVAV